MNKKKFKISKNKKYGFYQIKPTPSKEEITSYYANEFYSGDYKKFNDSSLKVQTEDKYFYESTWLDVYKNLKKIKNIKKNQTILDVGCGWGLALNFFKKKGFKCYGFDPAPEAIEYAKKKGVNAKVAGIDGLNIFSKLNFDIITFFNVFEHLSNPEKTINEVSKILKKNGILIIDVPNEFNDFQTVGKKVHKLKEWWVCPPNHLNYFSFDSMKKLLNKNGYELKYAHSSFPLEIFLLFGDNYVKNNNNLGRQCHLKRVNFEKNLRKFGKEETLNLFYENLAKMNLGRQITFYAQKK